MSRALSLAEAEMSTSRQVNTPVRRQTVISEPECFSAHANHHEQSAQVEIFQAAELLDKSMHRRNTHEPLEARKSKELDYSLQELSTKAYQELEAETLDSEPECRSGHPAHSTVLDRIEKLNQLLFLTGPDSALQREFLLASFSIPEYRSLGDLLIEKFQSIAAEFKGARDYRRKVIESLEYEVLIQAHKCSISVESVSYDLRRLKKAGKVIVNGRV